MSTCLGCIGYVERSQCHTSNRPPVLHFLAAVGEHTRRWAVQDRLLAIVNRGHFPVISKIIRNAAIRMALRREFIHYAESIAAIRGRKPLGRTLTDKELLGTKLRNGQVRGTCTGEGTQVRKLTSERCVAYDGDTPGAVRACAYAPGAGHRVAARAVS